MTVHAVDGPGRSIRRKLQLDALLPGRWLPPRIARSVPTALAMVMLATASVTLKASADHRATVIIAGDLGGGQHQSDGRATAQLIERIPGIVMTAGDNAYDDGTYLQYLEHYEPTWGRFFDRTRPVPGNHEYNTPGAAGYFRYFGHRAGPPGRGYYTFRAGPWRVFALDSEQCLSEKGCGPGSAQFEWLKRKMRTSRQQCQLAVWHRPVRSSGMHLGDPGAGPLLRLLYRRGADVVVNGHDHTYERMAPARPDGSVAWRFGIRQFIVGTGGADLRHEAPVRVNASQVFESSTHGVLVLRLGRNRYSWEFVPVKGKSFTDSGRGTCHGRPRR